jgi:hypothetical protein
MGIGDEHRLAMVDRNLRRPHLDFERHGFSGAFSARCGSAGTEGLECFRRPAPPRRLIRRATDGFRAGQGCRRSLASSIRSPICHLPRSRPGSRIALRVEWR